MQEMEQICFEIISNNGSAKSCYMEALAEASEGNFNKAEELIKEGEIWEKKGHTFHMELISKEANGNKTEFSLILMHAEDQLMNSQTIKILATEIIKLYKMMK